MNATLSSCTRPETCDSEGLDCVCCVRASARNIARLCPGLAPAALRSVFTRLYSHEYCETEFLAFELEYARAGRPAVVRAITATTAA